MEGYFVGWDGGGTGTVIECADPKGTVLYRGNSGPLNLNGNDPEHVRNTIRDAVQEMRALPGGLDGCLGLCVASAGISNRANKPLIGRFLAEAGFSAPYTLAGDHESAFCGALEGKPGILLISGTGSICFGKNSQGRECRCGGWGHVIDDGGSGYAIGRDILSVVVMAEDGRLPESLLTGMVYARLGISRVEELIGFVYAPDRPKKDIAALAPLAAEACQQGDAAAVRIEAKAAEDLFYLCETAAKRLSLKGASLALSGSILKKDHIIRKTVIEKAEASPLALKPCTPSGDAAHGAMLIARSAFECK